MFYTVEPKRTVYRIMSVRERVLLEREPFNTSKLLD